MSGASSIDPGGMARLSRDLRSQRALLEMSVPTASVALPGDDGGLSGQVAAFARAEMIASAELGRSIEGFASNLDEVASAGVAADRFQAR